MGWNQLEFSQPNLSLWQQLNANPYVYFVHSYYVNPVDSNVKAATVTHGTQEVTAAIARDNVMAVQFHPEKSAEEHEKLVGNAEAILQALKLLFCFGVCYITRYKA